MRFKHKLLSHSFHLAVRRVAAILLTVTFSTGEALAGVSPVSNFNPTNSESFALQNLNIPSEIGQVEETFFASDGRGPCVVHIKDAHANYDAQISIKQILTELHSRYGFKTVAVEGSASRLERRSLEFFKEKERNARVAEYLARKGEASGVDLFVLETENVDSFGVENIEDYASNLQSFRKVMQEKEASQRLIDYLEAQLDLVMPRLLDKDLLKFVKLWESFEVRQAELLNYMAVLSKEVKERIKVDFSNLKTQIEWPHMWRMLRLKELEAKLQPKEIEKEGNAVMDYLRKLGAEEELLMNAESVMAVRKDSNQPAKGPGKPRWSPRLTLERVYEFAHSKGFKFEDYPAFTEYARYLTLQNEMEAEGLFNEMDALSGRVLEALAKKSEEKEIIQFIKDIRMLKKVLALELLRSDVSKFRERKPELAPAAMAKRLDRLKETARVVNHKVDIQDTLLQLEPLMAEVERFYELADKRDEILISNTLEGMKAAGVKKIVLVTGGYHADGIRDRLKKEGISYVGIAPRIGNIGGENYYLDIMMNHLTQGTADDDHLAPTSLREPSDVFAVLQSPAGQEALRRRALAITRALQVAGNLRREDLPVVFLSPLFEGSPETVNAVLDRVSPALNIAASLSEIKTLLALGNIPQAVSSLQALLADLAISESPSILVVAALIGRLRAAGELDRFFDLLEEASKKIKTTGGLPQETTAALPVIDSLASQIRPFTQESLRQLRDKIEAVNFKNPGDNRIPPSDFDDILAGDLFPNEDLILPVFREQLQDANILPDLERLAVRTDSVLPERLGKVIEPQRIRPLVTGFAPAVRPLPTFFIGPPDEPDDLVGPINQAINAINPNRPFDLRPLEQLVLGPLFEPGGRPRDNARDIIARTGAAGPLERLGRVVEERIAPIATTGAPPDDVIPPAQLPLPEVLRRLRQLVAVSAPARGAIPLPVLVNRVRELGPNPLAGDLEPLAELITNPQITNNLTVPSTLPQTLRDQKILEPFRQIIISSIERINTQAAVPVIPGPVPTPQGSITVPQLITALRDIARILNIPAPPPVPQITAQNFQTIQAALQVPGVADLTPLVNFLIPGGQAISEDTARQVALSTPPDLREPFSGIVDRALALVQPLTTAGVPPQTNAIIPSNINRPDLARILNIISGTLGELKALPAIDRALLQNIQAGLQQGTPDLSGLLNLFTQDGRVISRETAGQIALEAPPEIRTLLREVLSQALQTLASLAQEAPVSQPLNQIVPLVRTALTKIESLLLPPAAVIEALTQQIADIPARAEVFAELARIVTSPALVTPELSLRPDVNIPQGIANAFQTLIPAALQALSNPEAPETINIPGSPVSFTNPQLTNLLRSLDQKLSEIFLPPAAVIERIAAQVSVASAASEAIVQTAQIVTNPALVTPELSLRPDVNLPQAVVNALQVLIAAALQALAKFDAPDDEIVSGLSIPLTNQGLADLLRNLDQKLTEISLPPAAVIEALTQQIADIPARAEVFAELARIVTSPALVTPELSLRPDVNIPQGIANAFQTLIPAALQALSNPEAPETINIPGSPVSFTNPQLTNLLRSLDQKLEQVPVAVAIPDVNTGRLFTLIDKILGQNASPSTAPNVVILSAAAELVTITSPFAVSPVAFNNFQNAVLRPANRGETFNLAIAASLGALTAPSVTAELPSVISFPGGSITPTDLAAALTRLDDLATPPAPEIASQLPETLSNIIAAIAQARESLNIISAVTAPALAPQQTQPLNSLISDLSRNLNTLQQQLSILARVPDLASEIRQQIEALHQRLESINLPNVLVLADTPTSTLLVVPQLPRVEQGINALASVVNGITELGQLPGFPVNNLPVNNPLVNPPALFSVDRFLVTPRQAAFAVETLRRRSIERKVSHEAEVAVVRTTKSVVPVPVLPRFLQASLLDEALPGLGIGSAYAYQTPVQAVVSEFHAIIRRTYAELYTENHTDAGAVIADFKNRLPTREDLMAYLAPQTFLTKLYVRIVVYEGVDEIKARELADWSRSLLDVNGNPISDRFDIVFAPADRAAEFIENIHSLRRPDRDKKTLLELLKDASPVIEDQTSFFKHAVYYAEQPVLREMSNLHQAAAWGVFYPVRTRKSLTDLPYTVIKLAHAALTREQLPETDQREFKFQLKTNLFKFVPGAELSQLLSAFAANMRRLLAAA